MPHNRGRSTHCQATPDGRHGARVQLCAWFHRLARGANPSQRDAVARREVGNAMAHAAQPSASRDVPQPSYSSPARNMRVDKEVASEMELLEGEPLRRQALRDCDLLASANQQKQAASAPAHRPASWIVSLPQRLVSTGHRLWGHDLRAKHPLRTVINATGAGANTTCRLATTRPMLNQSRHGNPHHKEQNLRSANALGLA